MRKPFAHDAARWQEFQKRCRAELNGKPDAWQPSLEAAKYGDVTLLYSTVLLKEFLEEQMG